MLVGWVSTAIGTEIKVLQTKSLISQRQKWQDNVQTRFDKKDIGRQDKKWKAQDQKQSLNKHETNKKSVPHVARENRIEQVNSISVVSSKQSGCRDFDPYRETSTQSERSVYEPERIGVHRSGAISQQEDTRWGRE